METPEEEADDFTVQKRVQPRRSLKGKRSEGYMADFIVPKKEVEEKQEEEVVDDEMNDKNYVSPKRGRGRPKRNAGVNQNKEEDSETRKTPKSRNERKRMNINIVKYDDRNKTITVTKNDDEEDLTGKPTKRRRRMKGEKNDSLQCNEELVIEEEEDVEHEENVERNKDSDLNEENVESNKDGDLNEENVENNKDGNSNEENVENNKNGDLNEENVENNKDSDLNEENVENNKEGELNEIETKDEKEPVPVMTEVHFTEMDRSTNDVLEKVVEELEEVLTEIHDAEKQENFAKQEDLAADSGNVCGEDASQENINSDKVDDKGMHPQNNEAENENSREKDLDADWWTRNGDDSQGSEGQSDTEELADEPKSKKSKYRHVCPYCKKNFMSKHYLRLHLPRHTGKFKCDFCGFFYARKESLQKHDCKMKRVIVEVEKQDGSGLSYACKKCEEEMATIEEARQHFASHGKEVTCQGCDATFASNKLLTDHECPNATSGNFECQICKQNFPSNKSLLRQPVMHTDIFKCKGCGKSYARKDSLIKHMLICCPSMTGEYEVYACSKCKKGFATKLGVDNHEARCTSDICLKCQKVFESTASMRKHAETCKADWNETKSEKVRYSCHECGKSFRNQAYLNRHQESHIGSFECENCKKLLNGKEELAKHKRFCDARIEISLKGSIKCEICSEEFEDAKFYRDHYLRHTNPYHCEKCGKYFVKIGTLHKHTCQIEVKAERCPICSKMFSNYQNCQLHQKFQHGVDLHCSRCEAKFTEKKDYLYHMCVDNDGNQKPFNKCMGTEVDKCMLVCHVCGRDFVSTSNLNKHMKIHGEKNIECNICHKKFHHMEYLKAHVEGVHEKRQKFQCSICGKVLTSKPGLVTHTKNFHAESKVEYPCPTCGKVFSQKGNMKTHMYSHAKERAFSCTHCPKAFKYPDQLNKHLLIHTTDQKFQCDLCDKEFLKDHDLKKHKDTFHNGMMYVCHICNSRYGHKNTLIRHYKRKHPGDFYLIKDEGFVDSLLQHVDSQYDSFTGANVELQEIQDGEEDENENEEDNSEEITHYEETMETAIVSHVAAEALQSLSNTTIVSPEIQGIDMNQVNGMFNNPGTIINLPGLDGNYQIQSIPQDADGVPSGDNTVVILQIVNQDHVQQEYQIQEVIEKSQLPPEVMTDDIQETYVENIQVQSME